MLSFTFQEAMELSCALEKSAETDPRVREKKALVDYAIFGHFKKGGWQQELSPALGSAAKGLGWGMGLAAPAVLGGHYLLNHARDNVKDVVHDARNQALLLGGAKAMGDVVSSGAKAFAHGYSAPSQFESLREETRPSDDMYRVFNQMKVSADQNLIEKLAAVIAIDNALEPLASKDANAQECLLINREVGVSLLRELV